MRFLALVLALALAPALVAADHVYSHRFVVEGRLVGLDGLPLMGRVVEVNVTGERLTDPCAGGHRNVTDEYGDFSFCYHRHDVVPNATIQVTAGNASRTRAIDADLRKMVFLLEDRSENGTAPTDWATRFRIDGRVWDRGLTRLDGVRVNGITLDRTPVNVTLERPGGGGNTFDLRTDGFGDYRAVFNLLDEEFPEDVTVRITVNNASAATRLDTTWHRMTVDFVFPIVETPTGPESAPGSTSGPVSPGLILIAVAGVGVAAWLARRKKA